MWRIGYRKKRQKDRKKMGEWQTNKGEKMLVFMNIYIHNRRRTEGGALAVCAEFQTA
jgi:hypothetical protein